MHCDQEPGNGFKTKCDIPFLMILNIVLVCLSLLSPKMFPPRLQAASHSNEPQLLNSKILRQLMQLYLYLSTVSLP